MPKMKTHSGAKKRFKKLKFKFKYSAAGKRHLLSKKTTKRKRDLRGGRIVSSSDHKHIARLLPNS
jgi:large subunit ribosomal protein L35